jgi:hypothetical protein
MMQQYASKEYWDTEQGKAMMALGQQQTAPKDAKLADYYTAQRAVGIGSMGEILEGLASVDDRYKEGGDLRKWAEANQGLALREYNKRFPGGTPGQGTGELTAPNIDAANPTAGEKALMDAKYALYGDPAEASAPGKYVPDDRVIGMNAQGRRTVGEGAYGFDPAFDSAVPVTEVLRGAPLTASGDPTEALAPGANRPGQPQAGYGGATVADVFNGPAALPSQSTTAGVVPPDTGMTPVREQGVPGLTEPPPSPLDIRDKNLNPATRLVDDFLGRAKLYTQGGMR